MAVKQRDASKAILFERSAVKWHFWDWSSIFSLLSRQQTNGHALNRGAILGKWCLNLPSKECTAANE